jgi:catecholate siderophore receptor
LRLLFATSVLALVISAPAVAQDETTPRRLGGLVVTDTAIDPLSIERPEDRGYKTDRIVSATRTDTPLIDVPQSITVVTSDQIRDIAATSIGDAIRYVPGVTTAQGEGNRETIVFRGNASTADFFVDGLRDDIQTYRDLYNIERLEVLRGPNAMIFGRGGVGGVINRVTKQAAWDPILGGRIEVGEYGFYRGNVDLGTALSDAVAVRLNGVYENSDSFRDFVFIERWGVNPTLALRLNDDTLIQIGYEHFEDRRVGDRGVPAAGAVPALPPPGQPRPRPIGPLRTPRGQFFGDPQQSINFTNTDALQLALEHRFSDTVTLRQRFRYADQRKFYENIYPDAVSTAANGQQTVNLLGYDVDNRRKTFVSQTDLTAELTTGGVKHTILAGFEFNNQINDLLRLSYDFDLGPGRQTALPRPVKSPTVSGTLFQRFQGSNDGNNFGELNGYGLYVQDQVDVTPWLQLIAGLRYDIYELDFTNRRTGANPRDLDYDAKFWSPRLGVVLKPAETASVYASYSRTALPRFGEQLASLTLSTANLAPERFENYEVGAKWDLTPDFNLSGAVFQLDRTNVAVQDPTNPLNTILAGRQRTRGFELGAQGQILPGLQVIGAYTYLDAEFTRNLSGSIRAGNRVPNTPRHIASLFGRYDVTDALGLGLGVVHQSARFATGDNLVRLPGYTRFDGALYWTVNERVQLQANVENLFNERYWVNSHNNNNHQPGAPTTFRVSATARF